MEQEILKLIGETLETRKQEQENIKEKLKKLEQLKQNYFVQKYLNLVKEVSPEKQRFAKMTDQELLQSVIDKIQSTIQTSNEIYFFYGNFLAVKQPNGKYYMSSIGSRNQEEVGEYRNIETNQGYSIPKEKCKEFEEGKIIIRAPEKNFPALENQYRVIQKIFFETAMKDGQEAAIQKVKQYHFKI